MYGLNIANTTVLDTSFYKLFQMQLLKLLFNIGWLTFGYNYISIQRHLDTKTFRYESKVSKCQKKVVQMSEYPNVRNNISKHQKYLNTH